MVQGKQNNIGRVTGESDPKLQTVGSAHESFAKVFLFNTLRKCQVLPI